MPRTNAQLPSAIELRELLAHESQRKAVRFDFIQKNRQVFASYEQIAARFGNNTDWINEYPTISLEELSLRIMNTTECLTEMICANKVGYVELNKLYGNLYVSESPRLADAIFVFGSPGDSRVHKAIKLYDQGFAPIIVLTGRGPYFQHAQNDVSEAKRSEIIALKAGVPAGAIITEDLSITLPDNVKRTIDIFEDTGNIPKKIISIATTYIMRRSMMEWYKFAPWDIEIIPVSADPLPDQLKRESWHKSQTGVRMLLNEYAKIVIEHKIDLMRKEGEV